MSQTMCILIGVLIGAFLSRTSLPVIGLKR
jgi:hypothetical protein